MLIIKGKKYFVGRGDVMKITIHKPHNKTTWVLSVNGVPRVAYRSKDAAVDAARSLIGDDALAQLLAAPWWAELAARAVCLALGALLVWWILP